MTMPENLPFYERHGFRVAAEAVEPESGIRFWWLWREPGARRQSAERGG
jgi:hypothetical protein